MSKDFDRWMERNAELGVMIIALVGEHALRNYLAKKHNILVMPVMLTLLVSRLGVEAAGMYIAYLIDGKDGMDAWLEFSDNTFSDYLLVPNPLKLFQMTLGSVDTLSRHYLVNPTLDTITAISRDPRANVLPHFARNVTKHYFGNLFDRTLRSPQFRFI